MSFLTTHPEALAAAAGELQTIDAALNAQNAAGAGPTTGLAPAAADEVSALQAAQFSAYGTLYQQISAQAAAMQEMFIHTLRASSDSYGLTETANSAAASSAGAGLGTATGAVGSGAADPTFGLGGIASNSAVLAAMNAANVGSAASAFTGLGTGFITNPSGVVHHVQGASSAELVAQTAPRTAPATAAPSAAAGNSALSKLASTPPGWAAEAAPAAATPGPLAAAGPAQPEPRGATTMPAGAPAVASSDRGGYGFGRPRYGTKPVVMPRKPVV